MISKKSFILDNLFVLIGLILLNGGFYFFFLPHNLVVGGVSGISVILYELGIKTSYTIFGLNVLFLLVGFFVLGKKYTLKTIYGSLMSPLIIFLFEVFSLSPSLIVDKLTEVPILMSTILGTLITGVGLGLVFRNDGSSGGIDILQNIFYKKVHIDYITAFLLTDGIIVLVGLIFFRDIQAFIYAVGSVLLFSLIIDNLSIAGRAGHTLFIVTKKEEEVKEAIYKKVDRGTTVLDAKGGYLGTDKKLIICVIHRKELVLTRYIVSEADSEAFIFIAQTKEAVGRGFTHH